MFWVAKFEPDIFVCKTFWILLDFAGGYVGFT